MARSLQFVAGDQQYHCDIAKVDRNKLYGWVEKKAFDREGNECYFGSISSDGMHMFGRGAFEQGYFAANGQWLNSKDLTVVDADNHRLEKQDTSFNQEINLDETVSLDTYLMHTAKSVYHLDASAALLTLVNENDEIFSFPFNYYASHTPDSAFLIASDGELFMVIGQHCGFEYLEMQTVDSAVLSDDDDDEDDDDIDFSMF